MAGQLGTSEKVSTIRLALTSNSSVLMFSVSGHDSSKLMTRRLVSTV